VGDRPFRMLGTYCRKVTRLGDVEMKSKTSATDKYQSKRV
jgi:hypothetical protein